MKNYESPNIVIFTVEDVDCLRVSEGFDSPITGFEF